MWATISARGRDPGQSGDSDPQLGITKAGNGYLRQLLVKCASHVMGSHGKDSALIRWGLSLSARGGSQRESDRGPHRIWTTREVYMPFESGLDYFGALTEARWRKQSVS
jgi:transposase